MQHLKKIAGINLLVLIAYTTLVFVFNYDEREGSFTIMLIMMPLIGIHVFVNIVLGIIFFTQKDNARGRAFLLSALVVLIVGFSSCLGSGALSDHVRYGT